MRAFFAVFLMVAASPGLSQEVLSRVQSDLDGRGVAETFTLLDSGTGTADLQIDGTTLGTVVARNVAWVGGIGQVPNLTLASNGSVQLNSMNDSVGRDRWHLILTIAYRNDAYRIAGYTYQWFDTLDPDNNGTCDVNLLTGQGEVAINEGSKKAFSQSLPALPVTDWTDMAINLPPDVCQ